MCVGNMGQSCHFFTQMSAARFKDSLNQDIIAGHKFGLYYHCTDMLTLKFGSITHTTVLRDVR
jgi:hypothetical protein